jgi:hypothetical protein
VDPEAISIRAASLLDEGTYTAVANVPLGTGTAFAKHRSEPWVLTVNALPLITEHPVVYAKFPGDTATLSVGGFFSPETRFTWYARYAGETAWLPLPSGADSRTHVISNVQIADEGEYQLEATNGAGTVVSNGTHMTVERPAFLTLRTGSLSTGTVGLSAGTVGVFPGSGGWRLNVAVTGALATSETVGDPMFLNAGSYVTVSRSTEMFAWIEDSSSETRTNAGGSTTTTTTYSYRRDWTSSPSSTASFHNGGESCARDNGGQRCANPDLSVPSESFSVANVQVGAWNIATAGVQGGCILGSECRGLPGGTPLELKRV